MVNDFIARFVWKKMSPLKGLRVLRGDGPQYGDCRNFALTMAWLLAGRSYLLMLGNILVFNTVLWFAWERVPHMTLWENGKGWICSNHRKWSRRSQSIRIVPIHPLWLVLAVYYYA